MEERDALSFAVIPQVLRLEGRLISSSRGSYAGYPSGKSKMEIMGGRHIIRPGVTYTPEGVGPLERWEKNSTMGRELGHSGVRRLGAES